MPRRPRTIDLQAAGNRIVIQIQGDGASAQRALEMVQEQMRRTAEASQRDSALMAEGFAAAKSALASLGVGLGLGAMVNELHRAVTGSVQLGVELRNLSQQTGISTENLSVMRYMSQQTGIGFEDLTKSFRKFSVEILGAEEGKKQSIQTFQRLGISQAEVKANGNDMLGMLGLVADRFKTLPDGPLKSAEAVALFGRAGMQMIPVLNQGRDGISAYAAEARALGIVLDESGIAKMEALHAATIRVQGALQGAQLGITAGMTPALISLEDALTAAIGGGNGMVGIGQKIGDVMLGAANAVAFMAKTIRQAKDEWVAFGALGNAVDSKLDSMLDVGAGPRARARQAHDQAVAAEKAALADRDQAEADYQRIANQLATGLSNPNVVTGQGESRAEHNRQKAQLGDLNLQDQSKPKHTQSDNGFLEARSQLAQEEAKAAADAIKTADQQQLAELESLHRQMLVSDQQFYAEKLRLQLDEIDTEENTLRQRQATLQKLYEQQHSDKTLKRDKTGSSAEELRTQRELLQVSEQMAALEARRGEVTSGNQAEVAAAAQNAQLGNLRAAAELEKARGTEISAQIALMREELALEVQRMQAQGASAGAIAETQALERYKEQLLQVGQVERQIQQTEDSYARQMQEVQDRESKGIESKRQAEQQLNQLREQEVAALATLAQQYQALADTLGGPFKEKAADLWAQLSKMSTPSQKGSGAFGQDLAKGMTSMADTLVEQSIRGKTSFKEMTKEMEADLAKLALKLLETKLMTSFGGGTSGAGGAPTGSGGGFGGGISGFFSSIFGALGEHHMSGGVGSGDPQVVGEAGPELWQPPTRGGTYTPSNMLTKLAESGGGGGAPKVTTNVVNQTSNPVTAQPSQVSWNAQLREMVVHTVLEDSSNGGPLSHLNPNNG